MAEDAGTVGTRALDERRTPQRPPEDPAQLRAEIERTRRELGDTVAALAEKTDVKARAKEKVSGIRHNASEKRTQLMGKARESSPDGASSMAVRVRATAQENPIPAAAAAAFVGGLLIGRLVKRR
jgi:ElaB/YqjD/DUF883 family membrane-anchored ribosome-binding protein